MTTDRSGALSEDGLPRKFHVWYRSRQRDQDDLKDAVLSWMNSRAASGTRFDFAQAGNIEFLVHPDLRETLNGNPIVSMLNPNEEHVFRNLITVQLVMSHKDPDRLFVHKTVAIYPEW